MRWTVIEATDIDLCINIYVNIPTHSHVNTNIHALHTYTHTQKKAIDPRQKPLWFDRTILEIASHHVNVLQKWACKVSTHNQTQKIQKEKGMCKELPETGICNPHISHHGVTPGSTTVILDNTRV